MVKQKKQIQTNYSRMKINHNFCYSREFALGLKRDSFIHQRSKKIITEIQTFNMKRKRKIFLNIKTSTHFLLGDQNIEFIENFSITHYACLSVRE